MLPVAPGYAALAVADFSNQRQHNQINAARNKKGKSVTTSATVTTFNVYDSDVFPFITPRLSASETSPLYLQWVRAVASSRSRRMNRTVKWGINAAFSWPRPGSNGADLPAFFSTSKQAEIEIDLFQRMCFLNSRS